MLFIVLYKREKKCVCACVFVCTLNASHSESDFPDILRDFLHPTDEQSHGRLIIIGNEKAIKYVF